MDSAFNGFRRHSVLLLMLLGINWSVVLPAAFKCSCTFQQLYDSTALMVHNTRHLQKEYNGTLQPGKATISYIPSDTVNGSSFAEKLQDIYTKNLLFQAHLQQVEKYVQDLNIILDLEKEFLEPKARLKAMCDKVKKHIQEMNPSMPVLITPEPLQQPNMSTYYQKCYGLTVLKRLGDWGKNVKRVIIEKCNKERCTLET